MSNDGEEKDGSLSTEREGYRMFFLLVDEMGFNRYTPLR